MMLMSSVSAVAASDDQEKQEKKLYCGDDDDNGDDDVNLLYLQMNSVQIYYRCLKLYLIIKHLVQELFVIDCFNYRRFTTQPFLMIHLNQLFNSYDVIPTSSFKIATDVKKLPQWLILYDDDINLYYCYSCHYYLTWFDMLLLATIKIMTTTTTTITTTTTRAKTQR